MQPSPLNLHFYYVTDLTFSVNQAYTGGTGVLPEDADLRILSDVKRSEDPDSEPEWIVTLKVQQLAADNLPYSFSVEIVGHFSVHPGLTDERRQKLLSQNGSAILLGCAREVIRSVTSMGPHMPLILPSCSFLPDKIAEAGSEAPGKESPSGQ